MNLTLSRKGFTMIELLVVMALMMFLLAMAAPFATSLRSEIAMRRTLSQIKTDIVTNMAYSLSGKSIAALTERDLMNPNLIPAYYGMYFETDDDYGDPKPYRYLEMQADIADPNERETKVIYELEKEMPSSVVTLKNIRIKEGVSDAGRDVDSVFFVFIPPFGRVTFLNGYDSVLSGGSFDSTDAFRESLDNRLVELDFQYKDNEASLSTLTFSTDKVINIL